MANDLDEFLKENLRPTFTFDSMVNQFLWDNQIDDENFDEAKAELAQLIKIARENPDAEIIIKQQYMTITYELTKVKISGYNYPDKPNYK